MNCKSSPRNNFYIVSTYEEINFFKILLSFPFPIRFSLGTRHSVYCNNINCFHNMFGMNFSIFNVIIKCKIKAKIILGFKIKSELFHINFWWFNSSLKSRNIFINSVSESTTTNQRTLLCLSRKRELWNSEEHSRMNSRGINKRTKLMIEKLAGPQNVFKTNSAFLQYNSMFLLFYSKCFKCNF